MDTTTWEGLKLASGRYEVRSQLGTGGMADVYAGTSVGAEGFARPVAIKRVLPGFSERPEFAAMFVDEARPGGHPQLKQSFARVEQVGELPRKRGPLTIETYALELLDGARGDALDRSQQPELE